jgi:2,3-dihydroxybenzoate decarboxylase
MKNKIALEEHFSIEGMTYKNDVMDAPTFADVRRWLVETESLRMESMDKAGIELSILSFVSLGIQAEKDSGVAVQHAKRANDFLCENVMARHPDR